MSDIEIKGKHNIIGLQTRTAKGSSQLNNFAKYDARFQEQVKL